MRAEDFVGYDDSLPRFVKLQKNCVFSEILGFFLESFFFTFLRSFSADEKSSMGHLFSWIIFSRRLPLCFIEVLNMTAFGIPQAMMAIIYKVEFHAFVKSYKYVTSSIWSHFDI